jgi:hypothetical protein
LKKTSRESYEESDGDDGEDDDGSDADNVNNDDVEQSEEDDVMSPPSGVNADDFDMTAKQIINPPSVTLEDPLIEHYLDKKGINGKDIEICEIVTI